jgi:hypothetical protein
MENEPVMAVSLAPLAAMAPPAEAAVPATDVDNLLPSATDDVFTAVCSVRGPNDSYPLAAQVGLPDAMCAALPQLSALERAACDHTFRLSNTSELKVTEAEVCSAAVSRTLGLTPEEMVACVRLPRMGQGRCMTALRSPLVLAENAPMAEQVRREQSRRAETTTGEAESVRRVRMLIDKEAPTREDMFELVSLCRWDRGRPEDARANEVIAETYLGLPLGQRVICTESNDFCADIGTVAGICHAVQHKLGTNAYVAKVDDFYASGGFVGADQRLAMTMQLYPEPYGGALSEIALACNLDRTQVDVAQSLLSTSRIDVLRNREICKRVEEGVGLLPRMDQNTAQVTALLAGSAPRKGER